MAKTTDQQLLDRLALLTKLVAVAVTTGHKQKDQITILNQAGFQPKEIAEILNTSGNTVRVALVALRKAKARKGKGKRAIKKA